MGFPFVSSGVQSIVSLKNGSDEIPWSLQPMVTIRSELFVIWKVISLGLFVVEDVDVFFFMACTTSGFDFVNGFVSCV